VLLLCVAAETWADEAQWAFQSKKHAMTPAERKAAGGDFARGFLTAGPFAISRHLNFFAEQGIWFSFSALAYAGGARGAAARGAFLGPLFLSMLFQGSTWLTEKLSVEKYPRYKDYQQTTSRLLPWFPGAPLKGN
jgi:steroid 5-alpha reductase family enzyme